MGFCFLDTLYCVDTVVSGHIVESAHCVCGVTVSAFCTQCYQEKPNPSQCLSEIHELQKSSRYNKFECLTDTGNT